MELVGDHPDYKESFLTGYFRDGRRRVDLIIVTKDTSSEPVEAMKMTFLMNAINIGLDIEVEAGSSDKDHDLNFIKVHAPEHILQHFGLYYNLKKFFKMSHLEFVNPAVYEEKEMIQIIRLIDNRIFLDVYPLHDGPNQVVPGQTALELNGRQALYYNWCGYRNLFRQVPLNTVREYLGERIGFFFAFYQFYNCFLFLLAVFGLFVFIKNYDIRDRNLQLNEHNMKNEYKFLVYDNEKIITEKYKPEEFTDSAGSSVTPTRTLTTTISIGSTYFKYPDMPMCPRCRNMVACPFRVMEAYRRELVCKVFLDNPMGYYIAFAAVIWGVLLYLLWTRKENYWYWMWETNEEDAKSLTRPEYRLLPKVRKPAKVRIIRKQSDMKIMETKYKEDEYHGQTKPKFRNTIEFIIIFLAICVVCLLYPAVMIEVSNKLLNKARYIEEAGKKLYPANITYPKYIATLDPKVGFKAIERFNHAVVDLIGSLNGVFILGMEIGWYKLEGFMLKKHTPRSEYLYERLHTSNLFGMTLLINFVVISFYAFVKGSLYTFPDDDVSWSYPLQLGMLNCGLLYCMDEVFLVFTATQKTKLFFEQIMCSLTKLPTDKQRDPKDYIPPVLDRTPCWERELHLLPITEDFVTLQYNRLMLQIAIVLCFISVFPLAALIAFLWNLWNFKYLAKLLIIHGRRPLMTQTWGLGAWREILFILPYLACFTNAIYLIRNNSLLDRKFNNRYWSHKKKRRFFADYFLGFFNMSDYNWSGQAKFYAAQYKINFGRLQQIKFCMFPGQYNRRITGRKLYVNSYTPMAGKWYISWRQTLFVLSFTIFVVGVSYILNTMISPVSEKVQDTKRVEAAVKQYGIEEMPKTKFE